jgi:hypothetical protein
VTSHYGGKGPTDSFLAHCHREMLHEQWKILLDEEFIEAYIHGIVIKCADGIERRFYIRIFTYSADYPEKYQFLFLSLMPLINAVHYSLGLSYQVFGTLAIALALDASFHLIKSTKWV